MNGQSFVVWQSASEGFLLCRRQSNLKTWKLRSSLRTRTCTRRSKMLSVLLGNKVLTDRIASVQPFFQKLRKAPLPVACKLLNLRQVLWPRALYGCEAVVLGPANLVSLRAGGMKATKWNRGGASPLVRIALRHLVLQNCFSQCVSCLCKMSLQHGFNTWTCYGYVGP